MEVARLGRSHGLEGAMRVHPTGPAGLDALSSVDEVWIDGLGDARVVELWRHAGGWLVRFDRVRRIEAAKELVHATVRVDPATLPDEVARELARPDLAGRPVLLNGAAWGEVVEADDRGPQPLLRVRGPAGEAIVPMGAPYVEVGDDAVRLQDPPPGLLDPA